jgi:hypothetical protein
MQLNGHCIQHLSKRCLRVLQLYNLTRITSSAASSSSADLLLCRCRLLLLLGRSCTMHASLNSSSHCTYCDAATFKALALKLLGYLS